MGGSSSKAKDKDKPSKKDKEKTTPQLHRVTPVAKKTPEAVAAEAPTGGSTPQGSTAPGMGPSAHPPASATPRGSAPKSKSTAAPAASPDGPVLLLGAAAAQSPAHSNSSLLHEASNSVDREFEAIANEFMHDKQNSWRTSRKQLFAGRDASPVGRRRSQKRRWYRPSHAAAAGPASPVASRATGCHAVRGPAVAGGSASPGAKP